MSRTEEFELIIVGGGPAGLCAAMYAGRGMLKAVLLERGVPGGELLNTEWIDDYPGFEHVLGRELAHKMAVHATKFGADIRQENVESIVRRADGIFEIATTNGTTYEAPTVILTAGGTPTKLGVPGELEYAGRGVSYCAVCDGAVGDSPPRVLQLAGHAQLGRGAARSEDDRRYLVGRAVRRRDLEDPVGAADDRLHVLLTDVGAELGRVDGHLVGQLAAEDVLEPGIVVDPLGVQQLAAGHAPLQQNGPEHPPAGIHGGAESGRPAADDDQLELLGATHPIPGVRFDEI